MGNTLWKQFRLRLSQSEDFIQLWKDRHAEIMKRSKQNNQKDVFLDYLGQQMTIYFNNFSSFVAHQRGGVFFGPLEAFVQLPRSTHRGTSRSHCRHAHIRTHPGEGRAPQAEVR